MESLIDPRYDIIEGGIWIKKEYVDSMTDIVATEMYPWQRISDVIKNDSSHYRGLYATYKLRCPRLFNTEYDLCYAFGGGMPKLEAKLNIKKIIVLDGMANKYIEHIDFFRKYHQYHNELEFKQLIFNSNTILQYPYDFNQNILLTFVHVLEHQSLDEHLAILKNLPANTDVIIYGPNVARYKHKGWVHGQDWILDHNTFIPFRKFQEILLELNYKLYLASEYSDDLLFYFNTGDKNGTR